MNSTASISANEESLPSMWKSPGFIAVLIAAAAAFGSWSLLLPVVPLAVINAGGSATLAGATTGLFMAATVITQLFTPLALRKMGYVPVMAVSAIILGVPALFYIAGTDPLLVLIVSAVRGIGFGALTVAESALIAELVSIKFLGKASGMLGVSVGFSQMLFLPTGLILAQHFSYHLVYALSAAIALIAALMCLRIPRIKAAEKISLEKPGVKKPNIMGQSLKLVAVPAVVLTSLSMTFGAISSFLPAAVVEVDPVQGAVLGGLILSFSSGAAMGSRYISGIIADRRGRAGSTMLPAQCTALGGVVLIALTIYSDWSIWLLLLGAIAFGAGFGMVQNEALLAMFFRLPRSQVSQASAIWNISFDAGTGLGGLILGASAAVLAYSGAFAIAAVVILIGVALSFSDRFLFRRPEHGHEAEIEV